MNVLFTVNTYYPLKDGVQLVTEYLAEGLVDRGHNVTVVTTKNGFADEEIHNGVKILRVDLYTKHTRYYGDKEYYKKLILDLASQCDVMINVCTQNPMTDLLFPILKELKCKKILYMHGMYDSKWSRASVRNISDVGHKIWNNVRWGHYYKTNASIFKRYDHIVQLHEYDDAYIFFKEKYNIECEVIGNACENTFFENCVKENYAIFVGNYLSGKNQSMILKAFYKSNVDLNFGLTLIGSSRTPYYEKLVCLKEELEKKYGKRKVDILYGLTREDTIKYIKYAKLYLMGSKGEKFPISIIEAMASGIPFVSTNVGIVRYLPGGQIVSNEQEMTYWISLLACSDKIATRYGDIGKAYAVEHFTISHSIDELEKLCYK